jgi:hypothetical protein
MRLRRGVISRPSACLHCKKVGRVDAHHPAYDQPDLVAFLCRSCHMRAHRDIAFEIEVARLAIQVPKVALPSPAPGGER